MSTTTTATDLFNILGTDYDLDQLSDIAKHGCAAGVSGLIYSSELYDLFTEYGEEVMEFLDNQADEMGAQSGLQMVIDSITKGDDEQYYSVQDTKETAIWMYVEIIAYEQCVKANHPDFV